MWFRSRAEVATGRSGRERAVTCQERGDIEAMGDRTPPSDDVVDELRDAQTRLAGEQARYQIAFRQDLAELADRLRRA